MIVLPASSNEGMPPAAQGWVMRCIIRILTLGLTTMLAFAGTATAAGPGLDAAHDAYVDAGDRYADLDAAAATDEAAAGLDTDANVADPEAAKDGGFFGWLQVGWTSFVAKLGGVFDALGHDAPDADGGAEAYVSDDGVDLDASLGGHTFDGSPVGDVDGKTFETMTTAKGKVEEVKGKLPTLG